MSEVRQQALIESPAAAVWDLIGDPRRYPEWWPRVVAVDGERFEEGDEFVFVSKQPFLGKASANFVLDTVDDLQEIRMHCTLSGTFVHWRVTEAQGGTFLDAELGMDPINARYAVFDRALGKRFYRRWLSESVEALRREAGP
jgi:uncharacterized protein YndB with AHSA1/START domain